MMCLLLASVATTQLQLVFGWPNMKEDNKIKLIFFYIVFGNTYKSNNNRVIAATTTKWW